MRFAILTIASFVVLIDGMLKWVALRFLEEGQVPVPALAFGVHKNFGAAFDLPLRLPIVIGISLCIGILLIHVVKKYWKDDPAFSLAALVILLGGAGNLYDRFAYGFTVDYLILFGRSAINLSDLLILCGIAWMLLQKQSFHRVPVDKI